MDVIDFMRPQLLHVALWLYVTITTGACDDSFLVDDRSSLSCTEVLGVHPSDHTWRLHDTSFFWIACRPQRPENRQVPSCDDVEFFMVNGDHLFAGLMNHSCWTINDYHDETDSCLRVEDYLNIAGWLTCD